MIQICIFKDNEKEGHEGKPQPSGKWKVPMLGGPWKVQMFGWQMEGSNVWWPLEGEKETSFSPFFNPPPNKFYLNLFFSIDLKILFYHGFRLLLMPFLPFL
jgi:hypothetical protein